MASATAAAVDWSLLDVRIGYFILWFLLILAYKEKEEWLALSFIAFLLISFPAWLFGTQNFGMPYFLLSGGCISSRRMFLILAARIETN